MAKNGQLYAPGILPREEMTLEYTTLEAAWVPQPIRMIAEHKNLSLILWIELRFPASPNLTGQASDSLYLLSYQDYDKNNNYHHKTNGNEKAFQKLTVAYLLNYSMVPESFLRS